MNLKLLEVAALGLEGWLKYSLFSHYIDYYVTKLHFFVLHYFFNDKYLRFLSHFTEVPIENNRCFMICLLNNLVEVPGNTAFFSLRFKLNTLLFFVFFNKMSLLWFVAALKTRFNDQNPCFYQFLYTYVTFGQSPDHFNNNQMFISLLKWCRLVDHDFTKNDVKQFSPPIRNSVSFDVDISTFHWLRAVKMKSWNKVITFVL